MAPFLIALLILGGGTSLAAKSALPESALYGVKTGFNENLRASFNATDEQKARWDAALEDRRLAEAEKLAAKGKLDAKAEAAVKARFDAEAQDYQKRMEAIAAKDAGSAKSVEMASNLEGTLRAHQDIMGSMNASANGGQMGGLLASVNTQVNSVAASRAALEAKFSSGTTATKADADARLAAAQDSINEARAYVSKMQASGSANASVNASASIDTAAQAMAAGQAAYSAGNYATAFLRFQDAQRMASETQATLSLRQQLNLGSDATATGTTQSQNGMNANGSGNVQGAAQGKVGVDAQTNGSASGSDTHASGSSSSGVKLNLGL